MSMIRENLEKWVGDMETTEDPQAQQALTVVGVGDCCLGRLCKVAIANDVSIMTEVNDDMPDMLVIAYNGKELFPPVVVSRWLGFEDDYKAEKFYNWCARFNDTLGLSFKEIGAAVRKAYLA
jgi:hypothetical protein